MPFGTVPTLEHNGKVVDQSLAIARYLAKKVKLVGDNDWENGEIDASVDTINDIRQSKKIWCLVGHVLNSACRNNRRISGKRRRKEKSSY